MVGGNYTSCILSRDERWLASQDRRSALRARRIGARRGAPERGTQFERLSVGAPCSAPAVVQGRLVSKTDLLWSEASICDGHHVRAGVNPS